MELIMLILGLWLAGLFIVYVVVPVGSIVGFICLVVGVGIGVFAAVKCYIQSIAANINPYDYYVDKSRTKQEFAERRSYFFGPGYVQLFRTVKDAWINIWKYTRKFSDIRENIIDAVDITFISQILWCAGWMFYLCAMATVGVLGSMITCVLGALHAAVLVGAMAIIYLLFSLTWLIDRIYLHSQSIQTSCPLDQNRAVVPMFECPQCGNIHSRLVPGPYGIWRRRCTCGKVLPTTFLMGRSNLKALCPICGTELAASDVQQFALTVVGGVSSGKTVLLSAFYHEMFERLKKSKNICVEIPEMHKEMFENMERWFGGERCPATALSSTADMYSVLIKSDDFRTARQFSLYDLAGEAFNDPQMATMIPQKQMRDSDGAIIVIDPLSAMAMRREASSEGDDTKGYSVAEAAEIINNFVVYLKAVLTNDNLRNKSSKPVSVVITKADLSSISRRISYHKIRMIMNSNPNVFGSFEEARDEVCREFLTDIGLSDAVKTIEAGFSEVHYFPVSAMGHTENGEEYEPEHVIEPFCWLIERTQPQLASVLKGEIDER